MRSGQRRSQVAVCALACCCCAPAFAEPAALDWEAAFPVEGAAKDVYLDAHFVGSDGTSHRLQLWRHGAQFLRRRTDEALDLYVHQAERAGDYSYRLIDHYRRVSIDVRRNQLYRIGVFSDWFGLAHVLDRPKTEFVARTVAALPQERQLPRLKESQMDCAWRSLQRGNRRSQDITRICWSAKWGLPLSIRARGPKGEWTEQFTVDRVESLSPTLDGAVLQAVPDGYAAFDAGNEIDPKEGD